MLDTEWSTGNIFKKLRSQTKQSTLNVLYSRSENIFDQLITNALPDICFIDRKSGQSIFNFDYTCINSVFISSAEIKQINNTYTKMLLFNHEDLSNIKKEDKMILSNNLKGVKILNFDRRSNDVFDDALNIDYPFPDLKSIKSSNPSKDILLIGDKQDPVITSISKQIEENNFSLDITNKIEGNLEDITKQLSEYRIVINLYDRINSGCALLCGCYVISHSSHADYIENNNIATFTNYNNILQTIKSCLSKPKPDISQIIHTYSIGDFSKKFKDYIDGNY